MSFQPVHLGSIQDGVKSLSLLSKLTIVVFTRSRPAFARRQAEFWGGRLPTLLILDNGMEPWSSAVVAGLGSNVHYSHDEGGFYRQMRQCGELVETEYAILIDDDNLLVEEGLEACILELESRAEFIAVSGQAAMLRYLRGRIILEPAYTENFRFSNKSPKVEERISLQFNPYRHTGWYAVQRTSTFRVLLPVVSEVSEHTPCAYTPEIGLELGLVILGATTTIPHLTLIRSVENPPEDDAFHSRSLYFQDWWLDERYHRETDHFVRCLKALAPDANASFWIFMVNELNQFASKAAKRAKPKMLVAVLKKNPITQVSWILGNLPLDRLRVWRWKFQYGLRLARALVLHPNNRSQGFIDLPSPRKVKARPSADLFDVTQGLVSVVNAVQRFYSPPRDTDALR